MFVSVTPEPNSVGIALETEIVGRKIGARLLSVDEVLIKTESELQVARKSISKMQNQLGTTVVDSHSNSEDELTDDGTVNVQIEQKDSFFAKKYGFKTNVRMIKSIMNKIVLIFKERFIFHFRLMAIGII